MPTPRARFLTRRHLASAALGSMAAVAAVCFVLYAIVPRPDAVEQPAVDVGPVATQLHRDADLTVWVPQLGPEWKATSARQGADPVSFYAGYSRADTDKVFVAVQQIPAGTPATQADPWRSAAVSGGHEDGTSTIDGTTWTRYDAGGDPARRGLVGRLGNTTTVVSGLADYPTLEAVVRSMRPYQG